MKLHVLTSLVILVGSLLGAERQGGDLTPDQEKRLLEDWLRMQSLASDEAEEWRRQKDLLKQTLDVYASERVLLEQEMEASSVEVDLQILEESKAELARYRASLVQVSEVIERLTPRFLTLIHQFPDSLKLSLEESINVLERKKLSNADSDVTGRLRAMIQILSEGEHFQRSITLAREEITLGDTVYEAEVVYFGLGRAFFRSGKKVGVGSPLNIGWRWEEVEESKLHMNLLIDVLENREKPELISLPMQIKP